MNIAKKLDLARRRHWRVRQRVTGTPERPRMSVKFTGQHIYVQFIDDERGVTLASASTRRKAAGAPGTLKANVPSAKVVGGLAADAAKAAGITQVVFDRGSAKYHGKVAALADAAREAGLKF
ncbi:MAG TPA: 50S ribosomal protein L18 [Verrucomicrobiota bacterium]|nr:50S ribosomal protein L18 [Verrucomicrobiota bacterium]